MSSVYMQGKLSPKSGKRLRSGELVVYSGAIRHKVGCAANLAIRALIAPDLGKLPLVVSETQRFGCVSFAAGNPGLLNF